MARLDTHILYTVLEDQDMQMVQKRDLQRFLDDPEEFVAARGLEAVGASQNVWIEEEINDFKVDKAVKGGKYDATLEKLRKYIKTHAINVVKYLKESDSSKSGEISRSEFLKFNEKIESPISNLEQMGLFNQLTESTGKTRTISDLGKNRQSNFF